MNKHMHIVGKLGSGRKGSSILELKYLIEEQAKNARVFRISALEKGLIYDHKNSLSPSRGQIRDAYSEFLNRRQGKGPICTN